MRVLCADDLGQITSNFRMNLLNEPLFVSCVILIYPEGNLLDQFNMTTKKYDIIFDISIWSSPVLFFFVASVVHGLINQAWGTVTTSYY